MDDDNIDRILRLLEMVKEEKASISRILRVSHKYDRTFLSSCHMSDPNSL